MKVIIRLMLSFLYSLAQNDHIKRLLLYLHWLTYAHENQCKYFRNATLCGKGMRKWDVAVLVMFYTIKTKIPEYKTYQGITESRSY